MHRCTNADSKTTATGKYDGTVDIYRDQLGGSYDATQLRHAEMNAIQEEIANVIRGEGISLQTDTETPAQMFQLETAINAKLVASRIDNDSGVSGTDVDDALDQLDSDIGGLDSTDIGNVSTVTGATVTAALNALDTLLGSLSSDDVDSDCGYLSGTTVTDDLDNLAERLYYDELFGTITGFNYEVITGGSDYFRVNFRTEGKTIGRPFGPYAQPIYRINAGDHYKNVVAGSALVSWVAGSGVGGCASALEDLPATPSTTFSGIQTSGSAVITSMTDTTKISVGDLVAISSTGFAPNKYVRVVGKSGTSITVHRTSSNTSGCTVEVAFRPLFVFALGKTTLMTAAEYGFDTSYSASNLMSDVAGDGYDLYRRIGHIIISGSIPGAAGGWAVIPMVKQGQRFILNESVKLEDTAIIGSTARSFTVPLRTDVNDYWYKIADMQFTYRSGGDTGAATQLDIRGDDGGGSADSILESLNLDTASSETYDTIQAMVPLRKISSEYYVRRSTGDLDGEFEARFRGWIEDLSSEWGT